MNRPPAQERTCIHCGVVFMSEARKCKGKWVHTAVCIECTRLQRRRSYYRRKKAEVFVRPATDKQIASASITSACKTCAYLDYCRQRVQICKSVACEPGNEKRAEVPRTRQTWTIPIGD